MSYITTVQLLVVRTACSYPLAVLGCELILGDLPYYHVQIDPYHIYKKLSLAANPTRRF